MLLAADVYVNDDWSIMTSGDAIIDADPVAAGDQNATFGVDAFATVQDGIDAADENGTVHVNAGNYLESPNVNKSVTLKSIEGRNVTTISLQSGPTYLGSLSVSGSDVTIDGFTVVGFDGTPTSLASTNVFLTSGLTRVAVINNRIQVGDVDATSTTGDDGIGLLTSYNTAVNVGSLIVDNNIFEPSASSARRAFFVNAGVDEFQFTNNAINGSFAATSITQAIDGLVESNTVTGVGAPGSRSAGIGAWGYPDSSLYGTTTFRANTISNARGISIYETENVSVEQNFLDNTDGGVSVVDLGTFPGMSVSGIHINDNRFTNIEGPVVTNDYAEALDAMRNFWGGLPATTGAVETVPVLGSATDTQPGVPGFQGDIASLPTIERYAETSESGFVGFLVGPTTWSGRISEVPSGTDGITSLNGSSHAIFEQTDDAGGLTGPFARFDGYRRNLGGGIITQVKIYLDPAAFVAGEGFDFSVAANDDSGAHRRDYIFHVAKDTSTGELLVGASNNTNFDPREDLDTINHAIIGSPGWYTFEHVMYEDENNALSVAMHLYDPTGTRKFTEVRSNNDTDFGGNRYLWFTNIDVANGIPVDSVSLATVDTNAVQRFNETGTEIISSHPTIQDAIDASSSGNLIRVSGGNFGGFVVDDGDQLTLELQGTITGAVDINDSATSVVAIGDLTMGDGSAVGFATEGTLETRDSTVTLLSSTEAELGAFTDVGLGGELEAGNGIALDSGDVLTGEGLVDADVQLLDGTISGNLTVSGELNGAQAPSGTVTPGFSPGTINTGNLSLNNADTLNLEVDGLTTAGVDFDRINVTGSVTLAGTLDFSGSDFTATTFGDSIILIENDGIADAISGVFDSYFDGVLVPGPVANNSLVSINGQDWILRYDGGDGNDLELVTAAVAPTVVYVDDDFSSTALGADPDGTGPATALGFDAFDTVQAGIDQVAAGGDVIIYDHSAAGYSEFLSVSGKDLDLLAATGNGPTINGAGLITDGLVISGSPTVTIDGLNFVNHTLDGIETTGVLTIQNTSVTGGVIGVNVVSGSAAIMNTVLANQNAFGAFAVAGSSIEVDNSEISGAGNSGLFVGAGGNLDIEQSAITSNDVGIKMAATSTVNVRGSNLAGNISVAIDNSAAGASVANASSNWWGSNGAIAVSNETVGLVDFTPYLDVGTDNDGGAVGFVGDTTAVHVTTLGSQIGPMSRINEGIAVVDASGTVIVEDGDYDETITIDKTISLESRNKFDRVSSTPSGASIAPQSGTQQTVVTVNATNVVIDGIAIQVNQNDNGSGAPIAPVAIAAVGPAPGNVADFDGLSIQNVDIRSVGDNSVNWTGSPTLSVAAAGIVLYDNAGGAVPTVSIADSVVDIDSGNSFFQRGVWLAQVEADITSNTLSGAANDLLFQFASAGTNGDGASLIDGNDFVGQHRAGGGGLNLSGPNASATLIDVSNNLFQPTPGDPANIQQAIVINQNTNSVPINIMGNTFDGHVVGIASGNSAAVEISGGNIFTPTTAVGDAGVQAALSGNDFVHIAIDSDAPSSGDSTTLPNAAKIFGNTFNVSAGTGTAIVVSDNLAGSTFAADGVEIGTGGANTYMPGLTVGVRVAGGVVTISDQIDDAVTGIAATGGSVNLAGSSLSDNTTGMIVDGTASLNLTTGNNISGGSTGILLNGPDIEVVANDLQDLIFAGQSGDYISLANMAFDNQELDGADLKFDGIAAATATAAELAVIGAKITDELDDNSLGLVDLGGRIVVTPTGASSATDNDYLRLKNAVEAAEAGDSIVLVPNGADAEFNWNEPNALSSWALGNDGLNGTDDDYTILLGDNQDNVTITAALADGITIQGPGDIAAANLEGVFAAFDNGTNNGWVFENFGILDFDNAIGFYFAADQFDDLTVRNMHIRVAADSTADVNQNIGIHYGRGTNISIDNNLFELVGGGDGTTFAIQSNTHGGAHYDGLAITNNVINVLNAGDETLYGIWENGHAHASNIDISGNQYNGIAGNTGSQTAFRISSHSSASTSVTYNDNVVDAADVAFDWLDIYSGTPQDYTGTMPILMDDNIVTNSATAFDIGGTNASATITAGSVTGASGIGIDIADGASATVSGATLQNLDIGVRVGGSAVIDGVLFDNPNDNLVDLQILATATSYSIDGGSQFGGDNYYIENLSSIPIDLSGALPAFDEVDNFRIEDKLYHATDDASSGLIRLVADELFVTTPGTGSNDESIQRAVNAASAGDTVNVETGTFSENLIIDKDLSIVGDAGGGTTVQAVAGNVVTVTGTGFGTADDHVTLDQLSLDGSSSANYGVFIEGAADLGTFTLSNADAQNFLRNAFIVLGSPTTAALVGQVDLTDSTFANNGISGGGGSGDIQFFGFNGNASLTNLVLTGNRNEVAGTGARLGVQFRGVGDPDNSGDGDGVMAMGTVSLDNLDISGTYRTQMIGIQRYSDVTGFALNNVALGGVGSGIVGGFGASLRFDAVGGNATSTADVDHPVTLDLSNTHFRGLDAGVTSQVHEVEFAPDNDYAFLRVDATDTIWRTTGDGDVVASALNVLQGFEVENRILHFVDKLNPTHTATFGGEYNGFVELINGEAFVTDQADNGVIGDGSVHRAIRVVDDAGTVNVSAGDFSEGSQTVVDKEVDIVGQGKASTIFRPGFDTGSSGDARGWWLVEDGANLDVHDIGFDGTGNLVYQAFRHQGEGSFNDVAFNNIQFNASGPHYQGVAIAAFGTGTRQVDVSDSMFTDIGRIGVLYFGSGTTGTFDGNTYTGKGVGDFLDYALDIGAGAVVNASNNSISNNQGVASSDGSTSGGILVSTYFAPGTQAVLSGNEISSSSVGVVVGYDSDDSSTVSLSGDNIHDNTGDGVFIIGGSATIADDTQITNNTGDGVEVTTNGTLDIRGSVTGIAGNAVGINVDGGTALIQDTNLAGNVVGVLIQQGGVADLGQTGVGTNLTGLGVSSGGNNFSGYTSAATATSGAIVVLNDDTGAVGPQGIGSGDIPAHENLFDASLTTATAVAAVIHDDTDDPNVAFLDYDNLDDLQISIAETTFNNGLFEENESLTLTGSFDNDGQAHTVTIAWGDGNSDTVPLAAGVFTFAVDHQYADDNEPNEYDVVVTVSEDVSGGASISDNTTLTDVEVVNVPPTLNLDAVATINENGVATFSGTITDPSSEDTFTLLVNWGDGSPVETFNYGAGTSNFSETHQYLDDNPSGDATNDYTISATLNDDDLGTDTKSTIVTVDNVAPSLQNFAVTPSITENGTVTLTGNISDPGTEDTFTLVVDWGDNSAIETFTYAAGTLAFSETHQYRDDNPTGDASNNYTINASLTDDDLGNDTQTTDVTVNNVPPLLQNVTVTPSINEHGSVTLMGDIVDPGTEDTFTLSVNWGEGAPEVVSFPAGTTDFVLTHQYLDDNPTGTSSDVYTIELTLDDDDNGHDAVIVSTTVDNVAPTLALTAVTGIHENEVATLSGTITDPGTEDTFTLLVDWGDGTAPETFTYGAGTTSFSETHQYLDNVPSGVAASYTIAATVTDDDTGADNKTTTVNVSNVAPTIELAGNASHNEDGSSPYSLTIGPISDPGDDDVSAAIVFWGDGSQDVLTPAELTDVKNGGTTLTHTYDDDEDFTGPISVTLVDEDGVHTDAGTFALAVNNVPPTAIPLNGGTVNEGSSGSVLFVGQSDASAADASEGFRYAYDFNNDGTFEVGDGTYSGSVNSASATVPGEFLKDNPSQDIGLRILDDDGGFTDYVTTITINNVTPIIASINNETAFVDSPFFKSVTITDPGVENDGIGDTPNGWTVSIDFDGGGVDRSFETLSRTFNVADGGAFTYDTPGTFTVSVTVDDNDGGVDVETFDVSVVNDSFRVIDLTNDASGFSATFNRDPDLDDLNLYDGQDASVDLPDLSLVGSTTGPVRGSMTYDSSSKTLHFVKTGGVLADDTYTVTLLSTAEAFNDGGNGSLLDGDNDFNPGGNFTDTFTIARGAARVVGFGADFARGPEQTVDDRQISISDGTNVYSVDLDLLYDSTKLDITGVTRSAGVPADWTVTFNDATPGIIKLTASGTSPLVGTNVAVYDLQANVPAGAMYGESQVLRITNLRVNEDNIASVADNVVHKLVYLGDASGNGSASEHSTTGLGKHSALDASYVSRVVVNLDSGFDAHDWTDPIIVGDVTQDGTLSGQDASDIALQAVELPAIITPIPDFPNNTYVQNTGVDPILSLPHLFGSPGDVVTAIASIDEADTLQAIDLKLEYDTSLLDLTNNDVGLTGLTVSGWSLVPNVDDSTGTLMIAAFTTSPLGPGTGELLNFAFGIPPTAALGVSPLDINDQESMLNEGGLALTDDDGSITVVDPVLVEGRYIVYENSSFDDPDGNGPLTGAGIDAFDDAAIAPKEALVPGNTAEFKNYTSFNRGINSIMVDLAGLATAPTLATIDDFFAFRVGNDDTFSSPGWTDAPSPIDLQVRAGAGANGSDRVTILWTDKQIENQWLEVQVRSYGATIDVHYWGNVIGEVGNQTGDTLVNATDQALTRDSFTPIFESEDISSAYDFNRDGLINATDQAIARDNFTPLFEDVKLISPIAPPSASTSLVPESFAALPAATLGNDVEEPHRKSITRGRKRDMQRMLLRIDDGKSKPLFETRLEVSSKYPADDLVSDQVFSKVLDEQFENDDDFWKVF